MIAIIIFAVLIALIYFFLHKGKKNAEALSDSRSEITAKYVLTDADYLKTKSKMLKDVKKRMVFQLGCNIQKALGDPVLEKDQDGREMYVYKFWIEK